MLLLFQIGVLIEDEEFIETSMNGEPWKAGNFSYTLQCSLWSEHLTLKLSLQITQISDPVADTTYRDLWLATAQVKKEISSVFWHVFEDFDSYTITGLI